MLESIACFLAGCVLLLAAGCGNIVPAESEAGRTNVDESSLTQRESDYRAWVYAELAAQALRAEQQRLQYEIAIQNYDNWARTLEGAYQSAADILTGQRSETGY